MDTNIELLEYIYETAKMGSSSMDRLCELLESKENLIRKDIDFFKYHFYEVIRKGQSILRLFS